MATEKRPDETGKTGPSETLRESDHDGDFERRRRELDATLATRRPAAQSDGAARKSSGTAGYGNALKLSSEFIAGILVGAGLGWVIDYWAGTSPLGLIVFLLLGFVAGVLNVLRSAGVVAETAVKGPGDGKPPDGKPSSK